MKVQIVYTETITREMTKEIEMTKAEYKEFLKMNKSEQDRKYDFCGERVLTNTTDDTTIVSIYF
jgi:hypothetical protein